MARPISIPILRDFDHMASDRIEAEINSVTQLDRISAWPAYRAKMGFGWGTSIETGWGFAKGLLFGMGTFGKGHFGQGSISRTRTTIAGFVAEDYSVRLRTYDRLGNVSSWSAAVTIQHRPNPPAPTNLQVSDSNLTWDWSDP